MVVEKLIHFVIKINIGDYILLRCYLYLYIGHFKIFFFLKNIFNKIKSSKIKLRQCCYEKKS